MARAKAAVVEDVTEDEVVEEEQHDLLDDLVFEEPPARTRSPRTGKWAKVLDALREHEGQWARIAVKPSASTAAALAGNLRSGTLAGAEKNEFEVTSRRISDEPEQYGVFARFNPNGEPDVEEPEEYEDDEYSDEDEYDEAE